MPKTPKTLEGDLAILGEAQTIRYLLTGFKDGLGLNIKTGEYAHGVDWADGYPFEGAQGAILWLRSEPDHRLDAIAVDFFLTPPLIRKPKCAYAELNGIARQKLDRYARRGFGKLCQVLAYMRANELRLRGDETPKVKTYAVLARQGFRAVTRLWKKTSTNLDIHRRHQPWDA